MDLDFVRHESAVKSAKVPLVTSKGVCSWYLIRADDLSRYLWIFLYTNKKSLITTVTLFLNTHRKNKLTTCPHRSRQ